MLLNLAPAFLGLVTLSSLLPARGTLEIEIAVTAGLAAVAVVLTALPAGGLAPLAVAWTLPAGAVLNPGTVDSPTITVTLPASTVASGT